MNDEIERMRAAVHRRMQSNVGKQPLHDTIGEPVSNILALHYLEKIPSLKKIKISLAINKEILKIAKTLSHMSNPEIKKGQQAKECAERTVLDIKAMKITPKKIMERCIEFRSLQRKHSIHDSERKPRGKPFELTCADGCRAFKITAEIDISRIGGTLQNCLCDKRRSNPYKKEFRDGRIGFYCIDSPEKKAAVMICYDIHNNTVREIKGFKNSTPFYYRNKIISLLARAKVKVGQTSDAADLAICDSLLAGDKGTCIIKIDNWTCHLGINALALISGKTHILLQHIEGNAYGLSFTYNPGGKIGALQEQEDYEMGYIDRSTIINEVKVRNWIQNNFNNDKTFAEACLKAFVNAPDLFVTSWFGLASGRPSPQLD